ncbi:AAA family ATPase [Roseomonas sp. ACRSG]|nr:AAA family ATPase [Roseomonas sp. ACRSG]
MLTKIDHIRNMGVFDNYTWDAALPAFARYNVIYGDNGTGKTTLSRLFNCLKAGTSTEHPGLSYKLSSASGDVVHGTACSKKIRVFNADYIQHNVGPLEGNLKHILVIGEENLAAVEALKDLQSELDTRERKINKAVEKMAGLDVSRGKIFTAIARTISEATSGASTRAYRKNNAEAAYAKLVDGQPLTDEELESHRTTLRQDQLALLEKIGYPSIEQGGRQRSTLYAAEDLIDDARTLCQRSALSDAIEALKRNPSVARWVEAGIGLHKEDLSGHCLFCDQVLPEERWSQIERHFSTEDQNLKDDLDRCLIDVKAIGVAVNAIAPPHKDLLYSELRNKYAEAAQDCTTAVTELVEGIRAIEAALENKLLEMVPGFRTVR